jgi:hypothetical protein
MDAGIVMRINRMNTLEMDAGISMSIREDHPKGLK